MLYEKEYLWENNDDKERFSNIDDDDDSIYYHGIGLEKNDDTSIIEDEEPDELH